MKSIIALVAVLVVGVKANAGQTARDMGGIKMDSTNIYPVPSMGVSAVSNSLVIGGLAGVEPSLIPGYDFNTVSGLTSTTINDVTVKKHIYVYIAPPEPEEFHPRPPISVGHATKHHKIIFIKTPSPQIHTAPIISQQAQNEEKTFVYVLVKKPDDAAEISIPNVPSTPPSKPEVYFIRYKAQKETTSNDGNTNVVTNGVNSVIASGNTVSTQVNDGIVGGGRPLSLYGPAGQSGPY